MNISSEKTTDTRDSDTSTVEKQDDVKKTPEHAVIEPSPKVPAVDEINPPLEATLGGDDVVVTSEKK